MLRQTASRHKINKAGEEKKKKKKKGGGGGRKWTQPSQTNNYYYSLSLSPHPLSSTHTLLLSLTQHTIYLSLPPLSSL